jgi:hypothetical protein
VRFVKVTGFKHLAIKGNHLVDIDGIVPADFRPHIVNPANVFLLFRQLAQTWTAFNFFA